uniref:Uncharacterized protein n=1 Tax=Solanum lycopersicum TaxID=4081 RepID=A0A3Q7HFP5_SOLLC
MLCSLLHHLNLSTQTSSDC